MPLKLATWNINSVRLRLPIVLKFLAEQAPDVLCLQETKCPDGEFPTAQFKKAGYPHMAIHGQKGYHGVATLSKVPLVEIEKRAFCGKNDSRHVSARIASGKAKGIVIHNFYVPAGGDEPDPAINEKFAHKLGFVDEMTDWFGKGDVTREHAILVGDLNIAPLEHDVWSHKALLSVVSHTPIEVEKLNAAQAAGSWVDAMRTKVPADQKLYTWWSYRSPNWELADKGRRLDHIWLSPSLAPSLNGMQVLKEARGWERPSDHAPVIAELKL
ncbi:exodeoxyribonuclease III [Methylovirgula sp. 4M-Z18]|uniref:exodeoxyribonuclease III n=1 Tax=Methylovirgula sp. 4M-Z18 TaxID=2293567 RepID=UPI000E2E7B4B|nr:exodeoxyribonuclease III [Methylovirgula sp. 4M-Z18]RFB78527.1 exodeoxyribonuclease III [Methylovirgula sp. 4M-Z18]